MMNFTGYPNLKAFDMRGNKLTGQWPKEFETVPGMTTIGLSGNLFPMPIAFDATAQLPTIQLLYLGRDPEDVVPAARVPYPTAYSLAPKLKELNVAGLFYGNFTCPNSSALTVLVAGYNDFAGQPFPLCMAKPGCRMTTYDVASSGFKGVFPTELLQCTTLQILHIGGSDFQGSSIPTEIGTLRSLSQFYMDKSVNLASTLPTELAQIPTLQYVQISDTPGLTGTLPTELAQLKNLQEINVRNTSVNGFIPQEYAYLRTLKYFDLSYTLVKGNVPGWIFQMRQNATVNLAFSPGLINCSFPGMRTRFIPAGGLVLPNSNVDINTDRPMLLCDPCVPPAPVPEAVCFNFAWFVPNSNVTYVLPTNGTVSVTSPVVIGGDFTLPIGSVIQITSSGSDTVPFLTVNGTADISGTLVIQLTQVTPTATITVLSAGTIVGNFTDIVVAQTYNGCAYSSSQTSTGGTLSVLLSVDAKCSSTSGNSSHRNIVPIVAGSVAGAIVLIAIVIAVTLLVMRKTRGHWLWHHDDDEGVLSM